MSCFFPPRPVPAGSLEKFCSCYCVFVCVEYSALAINLCAAIHVVAAGYVLLLLPSPPSLLLPPLLLLCVHDDACLDNADKMPLLFL